MQAPTPHSPDRNARPGPAAGRVALVTGGGRRLGRAIALALAADGWDVAIHYGQSATDAEDTARQIRALGRRAICLQAALEDEAAVLALVPAAAAQLGPVDALINNASRFVFDDIRSATRDSLTSHLLPNLVAPILLARSLAEGFDTRSASGPDARGVIINLLDQKLVNPNPDFLSYTVAKAGLAAATTMLAQALAPRIRVVGIAPGLTLPSYLQDAGSFQDAHARFSPLGASSTPEDIADAVRFAVNNRSITGTTLVVDGGQHLLGLPRDVSLMPPAAGASPGPERVGTIGNPMAAAPSPQSPSPQTNPAKPS